MKNITYIIVPVVLLALLGGCATQVRDDDPYAVRVRKLEQQVDHLDRVMKNQSLIDMADRMDTLQQQLQDLRGQVQELAHDMDQTKQRQRDLYLDLDKRLRSLELGSGAPPAAGGSSAPAAGQLPGAVPAGSGAAGQQAGAGEAPATGSGDDQAEYQKAFDLLKQGRYQEARTAFKGFLAKYPSSPLDDNAQYWLGEVSYVSRDFKTALTDFQKVLDKYPDSAKAADALLKVGYCQYELQNWDKAKASLTAVTQKYPDSTAARLANQRLKRMKDEGH